MRNFIKNRFIKNILLLVFLWLFVSAFLVFFANKIIFITAFSQGPANSRFDYEEVFLDYSDDQKLYIAQSLKKKGDSNVVLFLHGNGGMIGRVIDALANHYNVIVPAYPGYHLSTGKPSEEKLYEVVDVSMKYLNSLGYRDENVIVFGASLGGASALYAAGKYPDVKVAITVGTFDKIQNVCYEIYSIFCVFAGSLFDNTKLAKKAKGKVRAFHSADDEVVNYEFGKSLFEYIVSQDKKFVTIKGGHNEFIAVDIIQESLEP